uniref:Uncharacterized protein n=1 Tax=Anguilla anguilla TaxID=7936 RepID=A0A0E9UB33_ANGAN
MTTCIKVSKVDFLITFHLMTGRANA